MVCVPIVYSFLLPRIFLFYGLCHNVFIYSPVDGCLGFFSQFLVNINTAAVNVSDKCLCGHTLFS